ncbi:ATP-grasp domain-containing protein [Thermodesulfobacteriota bacterium]
MTSNLISSLKGVKIITTDPGKRIGLYAIRYLGKAGAEVHCISPSPQGNIPVGLLSKYCRKKILFERDFEKSFKDYLVNYAQNYDFVNPVEVSKMHMLLDVAKMHNIKCAYLLPSELSLRVADNKELLTRHATSVGLLCPQTFFQVPEEEIENLSHSSLTYPCIIKFRGDNRASHWRPEDRYSIVNTPDALVTEYRRMFQIEPYPIIQEYIYGWGCGYFALYDSNRNLAAQFCHKRIREYPVSGGPSSCCQSFYDEELVRIGRTLFESLEWTGLGMVEFIYDVSRKKYYIIEVNPRYWGSLPLAVHSGVNFPVLHAMSALNQKYTPVMDYRINVKLRFWERDIKSIFSNLRMQNSISTKMKLLIDLFNPTIKDGVINLDDSTALIKSFLSNNISLIRENFLSRM